MKQTPSLDALLLFLAVADAGGLAGAARATGVSVPTLSRQMATLERQLSKHLFVRGPRGYTLTGVGRAFAEEVQGLREVAERLRHLQSSGAPVRVRITAGHWTSRFLISNIHRVWSLDASWIPEFLPADTQLDIARRAADIGIRNVRPTQTWLAGQQTAQITYAPFASDPNVERWVAVPKASAVTPSQKWVWTHHEQAIATTASDPRSVLDLALAGFGKAVLPLFVGASQSNLCQVSSTLSALTHPEWLVSHHETRHDPPIRAALDAVASILTDRTLRPQP